MCKSSISQLKWVKDINIAQKEIQKLTLSKRKITYLLNIGMKIKRTLRYHFSPIRLEKIQMLIIYWVGKNVLLPRI